MNENSKITYTPQQQAAITTFGQNVLVAASAGSGKTKVLVQRVLQLLQNGIGVDELLVVTFTKAAAAEMKERIQKSLQAAIKQSVNNDDLQKQWLQNQLLKLKTADISTIDAFCLHLIQQYYYVIGLDPVFRQLTDPTERQMLAEDVWSQVEEAKYAQNKPAFEQLSQNFSNDRSDDGLTDVVMEIFEYANVRPDPVTWVKKLPLAYVWTKNVDFQQSSFFQQTLAPVLQGKLMNISSQLAFLSKQAQAAGLIKFEETNKTDQKQVSRLLELLKTSSWDQLQNAVQNFKWTRLATQKLTDEQKNVKDQLADQRDELKNEFKKLQEGFFSQTEEQLQQISDQAQKIVAELSQTVLNFMTAFSAEKKRRQLLDFSDIEHLAYQILTDRSSVGRQVQKNLQQHFKEVMVDEYQDTNQLQEAILQQLVKKSPGDLFMVGDAKQSIYGFRQADPTLFLNKMHRYQRQQATDGSLILLPDNFRSTETIDEFNNLIFSQLMDEKIGGIDYQQTAQLKYGAIRYDALKSQQVEILLYTDQSQQNTAAKSSPGFGEPYQPDFSADSLAQGEIRLVGQKIKELVSNQTHKILDEKQTRKIKYSDIAILSPTRNNNLLILEEFQQLGIPVIVKDAQNYFQTTEIQIMVSMLQLIDNPYQDIPLVSVLRSPIVGLKENELAYLRINDKTDDYFTSVMKFWQNFVPDQTNAFTFQLYQRIDRFIKLLKDLRTFSRRNELAALIWRIYDQTGFLDYVGGMPNGTQRQANLHALYQRASEYEKMSYQGLFQFIRFILRMQAQQHDLAAAPAQSSLNAVQLMTIHGSKGLEFPVVFLIDTAHQINRQDLQRSYQLDSHGGIGIDWLDLQTRIKFPTIQKLLLADQAQTKLAAEQMRLLYVALTRAEQKLIITGSYADPKKALTNWEKAQASSTWLLPDSLRQKAKSFMDWLGACLIRHPEFKKQVKSAVEVQELPQLATFKTTFSISWISPDQLPPMASKTTAKSNQSQLTADQQFELEKIKKQLSFKYSDQLLTQTTAYQSVSEIKRLFNDPDEAELDFMEQVDRPTRPAKARRLVSSDLRLPQFMHETQKVAPTQLGTAVHLVLQKISLREKPTTTAIAQLIKRLVEEGLLEKRIAAKVNQQRIMDFFGSSLGKKLLLHPQQVQREVPFSLLLPAKQIFPQVSGSQADILVHGIIDGFLATDSEVLLFDYKTDFVLSNDQAKIQAICDRYRGQLNLYAQALGKILQRPVTHKYLYLLSASKLIEV